MRREKSVQAMSVPAHVMLRVWTFYASECEEAMQLRSCVYGGRDGW